MIRFRSLIQALKYVNCPVSHESITQHCVLGVNYSYSNQKRFCSKEVLSEKEALKKAEILLGPGNDVDLTDYGPPALPSYKFAAYVDKSPLLQKLIDMGVNLHKLEESPRVGEFILTLNFEKNVKPFLVFLHDNGVPAEEFGEIITKHPFIFKEDLEDLEVRVNYLLSKKFDKSMISNIITRNPKWLSTPVKVIDARLGFLQQSFNLNGDQVRKIVSNVPSLGTIKKERLMVNIFSLKEEMEIEPYTLKKLIVEMPTLLRIDPNNLINTYDYLTRVMKVPQCLILKQPKVLSCRKFILRERHQFLATLGRAQYQPTLPGYIALEDLATTSDDEFCIRIAKTPVETYNEFLKTL